MAKNKLPMADVTEDPHYHDTWTLLRKYRDVVWSLEVSVRQVRNRFRIDYGKTIEDFLESVYLAGADLSGTELELSLIHFYMCIRDRSNPFRRKQGAVTCFRSWATRCGGSCTDATAQIPLTNGCSFLRLC